MKTSRILYTLVIVQAATLAYVVFAPSQPTAMAQIPDQGAQLQAVVDQTKEVNVKLDRIIGILEGGKMQVKIAQDK